MLAYATADLVGVFLETAIFGAYTVLFCICIWVIFTKRTINLLLSASAVANYTLSMVYIALDLRRVSDSFAIQVDPTISVYTSDHTGTLGYIISYTYVANSLIADSVLVWRCYAVWGKNIWICLPSIIMIFGTGIAGFGSVYTLSHVRSIQIVGPEVAKWGKAAIATAISTNVVTTGLIAGRIWWQKNQIKQAFGNDTKYSRYYNVILALVIESGAIYSTTLLVELVLYTLNSTGLLIVVSMLSQIMGIVPTLIIVYAALGNPAKLSTYEDPSSTDQVCTEATIEIGRVSISRPLTTGGTVDDGSSLHAPSGSDISAQPKSPSDPRCEVERARNRVVIPGRRAPPVRLSSLRSLQADCHSSIPDGYNPSSDPYRPQTRLTTSSS